MKQLKQLRDNITTLITALNDDISALNDQIIELEDAKTQLEDIQYGLNVDEAETHPEPPEPTRKVKKGYRRIGSAFDAIRSMLQTQPWMTQKELGKALGCSPGAIGFQLRNHKKAVVCKRMGGKVKYGLK